MKEKSKCAGKQYIGNSSPQIIANIITIYFALQFIRMQVPTETENIKNPLKYNQFLLYMPYARYNYPYQHPAAWAII